MNISGGVLKFLALLLAFVLGFLACAGSLILGGLYIYKNVSYETLKSWGVPLPSTDELLDSHADVRLTSLTLAELVAEMQTISGYGDRLTMELLVDRYGVKLSEELEGLLPEALMEVSLVTLFSAEGLDYLLSNTEVSYLFRFLPTETLSEPARDALADKKLSELMEGDIGALLADVKLGYFLDVTYEQKEDGSYTLVYADDEHPTTNELIAPLSLGALIEEAAEGGDILGVVKKDIGDCELLQLLGEHTDGAMEVFVENKTLGDLIVYDSATGKHVFDTDRLTADMYLGDIMGYEAVKDDPEDPDRVTAWLEGGEKVTALEGAMADVLLNDFMGSSFEMTDAVGHLYLGEVMGFEKEAKESRDATATETYNWYEKELDADGNRVPLTGVEKAVANVLLGDVLRGKRDAVTSVISDMYLGELMDYEKGKETVDDEGKVTYEWSDAGTELTGIDKAIANILLDDLLNNEEYEISDAFADLYLGEAIGYERGDTVADATEDAPAEYDWLEDGKSVSGIQQKFANYLLGDIIDGTADISADDMHLYEVMDLHKKEYPAYDESGENLLTTYTVWYEDEACTKKKAATVFSALAEVTVADLNTALSDMKIGATVGMVEHAKAWYDVSEVKERTVGDETEAYVVLTPAEGIMTSFASLSIDDMSDDGEVRKAVNKISIAEALGYTKRDDGKYYDENDQQISGIMAVLAPKKVGELSSDVDKIYIGEVMGWTPVHGDTSDPEKVTAWKDETDNEPTGIMSYFASLTVKEMSDAEAVHGVVQTIKLYDALGYTEVKITDGETEETLYYAVDVTDTLKYVYDEGKEGYFAIDDTERETPIQPISGIMAVLAPKAVGELELEIDKLYVGEIMGWTPVKDSNNPDTLQWLDEDLQPASGFMLAFAGLTVNQMSDEAAVHKVVKTLTLAEAMNYTKGDNGLYYEENVLNTQDYTYDYDKETYFDKDGNLVEPISGVLATLVDAQIGNMQWEVEHTYVGEMMGWTPEWNDEEDPSQGAKEWYTDTQKTQVARGLARPFASMTLSEMSDEDKVEKKVESIYVHEVMGYYKDENTQDEKGRYYEYDITDTDLYVYNATEDAYYDTTTKEKIPPVDGIMGALAGIQISALDDEVKDLTVADIFSEADRSQGFLSLIDPTTRLYASGGQKGLAETVTDVFQTETVGTFLNKGLISLDADTERKLNDYDKFKGYNEGHWKTRTINGLLKYITESLPST